MKNQRKPKKRKVLWILFGFLGLLLLIFIGGIIYINMDYDANAYAKEHMKSSEAVEVYQENRYIIFEPKTYDTGIIFYPGGKVEATAYAPLLKGLAEEGYLCILCEMPFKLAVFDVDAAQGLQERFTIDRWYMAGHSLGGAMAASYLAKHKEDYEGLILLAAYSTEDLSETSLQVLSIYGEEDQVLDMKKYQSNLKHLPATYREYQIPGGCHAYFGSYGKQKKDGIPTITNEQQIEKTIAFITTSLEGNRISYLESVEAFANPDCGFYEPVYIKCTPKEVSKVQEGYLKYNALLHLRIDISSFSSRVNQNKDLEFTSQMLDQFDQQLDRMNRASCCIILRFAYDPGFSGNKDMEPDIKLQKKHIEALKPLFYKYERMITAVEFGLIGPWGEMHSSQLAQQSTYNQLIPIYLDALPKSVKLLVRRPKFIYSYYGYTLATLDQFHEMDCRLGVYNDGYLGSATDLGTYDDRKLETEFLNKLNDKTPYGGEVTVPGSGYNSLNQAVEEMYQLHLSYLNRSWNDQVIRQWKEASYTGQDTLYQGKTEYDYIQNHLGYRFVLTDMVYKDQGATLNLTLHLKNVGFGNLCKSKNAYLIFQNESHTYSFCFEDVDIQKLSLTINKESLEKGEYAIYFALADDFKESGIRSIRFGNEGLWNDTLKANRLAESYHNK